MTKYIVGNWKMNGTREAGIELAQAVARHLRPGTQAEVVICPPFTLLGEIGAALNNIPHPGPLPKGEGADKPSPLGSPLRSSSFGGLSATQPPEALAQGGRWREAPGEGKLHLGAQDCSAEASGAFTGDVSAAQLKDTGCEYVILGHSERRAHHGETSQLVKRKAEAAIQAGLTPIICVGESEAEREGRVYLAVITEQIKESIPKMSDVGCQMSSDSRHPTSDIRYLVAYEPVWAIGSGKTPSPAEISEVHKLIAKCLEGAIKPPILYGGSVKPANAREILAIAGVDGVLVGGASLKAVEFCAIVDGA